MNMRYYETLYLIKPNLSEEEYKAIVDKFNSLIEKNKGVLIKVDEWGIRTLAYEIKKFDKGYYVLLQYCGHPAIIQELKRDLSLDERILKYQTIKLSDNADPAELKEMAEKGSAESGGDSALSAGSESDKEGETIINRDQEGEDGE
ncbi:MAG TPA: 30S ribosomal protein S6 [Desulfobacteraceae bacterium]|nr:30S ribosomal protein S6 [Desulfobacteraceae bacterium]HPJ68891.1 30S ribosomal protein S6 [Desulfobacteraceae bacterium]HPQ28912.1 30S ribosomal protein S6 [Desulfobacteraceae bacterium]